MSMNQPILRIAIVGTGVIGASWAAYYLAHGQGPERQHQLDAAGGRRGPAYPNM